MPTLTEDQGHIDDPVIAMQRVAKTYLRAGSSTRVLEHVDFTARRGECVFFVGPSGSGKTTLLSIIGCLLTADQGDVYVLGQNVKRLSQSELAQLRLRHIGFVFQRFHLIRGLTAAENVAVPLRLAGWQTTRAHQRASELLALVGMSDKLHAQPHRLSVGQCQRVALARALALDPDVILADEPTASLDAKSGWGALELLRRLALEARKSVIVVTHDPRIERFADRILRLQNGRLAPPARGEDEQPLLVPGQMPQLVAAH